MNEHTPNVEIDYERHVRGLDSCGSVVTSLIQSILNVENIKFHSVDHRVKSENSASKKLVAKADRYRGYGDITDLLGVRVITYFEDDVDKVAKCIERQFSVDAENSEDKRALLDSDRFGYLSLHYMLSFDARRSKLPEYAPFAHVKFEQQIRSVLQHAWAEIEHDLGYKLDGGLPKELRRGFSRLASLLEVADNEFISLRDR
ncbi:hypothetical protein DMH04_50530 [Kibdelosporangium aridum]|uniref:RelA/SpoT domain-containing protein n=1 Tax=Kibdelosporangium aridum TaxID=2030 RepID=A0A428YB42_KIBAR|nr:hypothetical protein [Kibdelosporangium aridum]RSM64866.1 hypothetical protein DMH04_50530 [Kibdelosporangium aridum]